MDSDTLDPQPPFYAEDGREKKSVKTALQVIEKNASAKSDREAINEAIQELFEEGFEVSDPTGLKKIHSQVIQQAIWRTLAMIKPLDFTVHGSGRSEEIEKLVMDGVSTVMDKGGYLRSLRDKEGAFQKLLMYGDGFIHVGTDDKTPYPIKFNPISNSNIYVDTYSTGIRSGGVGRSTSKIVVIFSMPWTKAIKVYPQLKTKGGLGKIPRQLSYGKELERDIKDTDNKDDLVEVAHFYDIDNLNYTCFAGSNCTVLKEYKGGNYPYFLSNEPYIPVLQYICYPSAEGFYNYGIGNMLYRISVVQRRLMNMAVGHVEDNTWPITVFNVPEGETGSFFNKLSIAHDMRAVGRRGYIVNEYSATQRNDVRGDALVTQSLMNEWQLLFDRLDREISRLGINLDSIERGADVTASQIFAEEESQNSFVKQIMENNASESKFAVDITMDFIRKTIDTGDSTPIDLTTVVKLPTENGKVSLEQMSMGAISDELRKFNYFTRINSRSGVIPSRLMEVAQIERLLMVVAPGTPAYTKLIGQYASLMDRDITADMLQMQQQVPSGGTEITPSQPAQTEKARMTPYQKAPMPAI